MNMDGIHHPQLRYMEPKVVQKPPAKRPKSSESSKKKRPRRRKRMLTGVSKQRRAANERERKRLQIINDAFKKLKSILPLFPGEENISKIEIVRLASRTIKYLADIVDKDESGICTNSGCDLFDEFSSSSSLGCGQSHSHSSCDSYCNDSLPDPSELSPVEFDMSQKGEDIDVSFLLFPPEDFKLTEFDSGPDLPSPTESDSSSKDSFAGLDFPSFFDQAQADTNDDDNFFTSPSMLFW